MVLLMLSPTFRWQDFDSWRPGQTSLYFPASRPLEQLHLEVQGLLVDSIAPRTHSVYQRAWQFFRWFNLRHGFSPDSHPSLDQLVQFIAFCPLTDTPQLQ